MKWCLSILIEEVYFSYSKNICISIIRKHSKDFGGNLEDSDVMKLAGISRNSYYKYKRELKTNLAMSE